MNEPEQESDQHAINVWTASVEHHGTVGTFELPYLTGSLHKDKVSAVLRLHKDIIRGGYMIYVNDWGGDPLDFSSDSEKKYENTFIQIMVELVRKLRLEGVQITWVNIQFSESSGRLGEEINKQIEN